MSENQEIIGYIKKAFELKEQKCYKQAVELFYKALTIEPDNFELLLQVGELYYLLNNTERAVQYPEQILAQDNENIPALKLTAKIYAKEDKWLSVNEVTENIYEIDPSEENLAELIRIKGKVDLLEDLEPYRDKISDSAKCLSILANEYFNKNNYDKAQELLSKAELLNPDDENFALLRVKILFNQNDLVGAKEVFNNLDKNSENPEILNFRGLFDMEECNFLEAVKNFSKAINKDKNNPIYYYNLGNAYFLNGWMKEAQSAYQKAIFLAPNNYDYRYSLAYLYFRNGNFEKTKKEVDVILENDGCHKHAKVLKALLLLNNKDYLGAEKILLACVGDKTDDFVLSSLAKVEVEIGKFDSAEKHLKFVIEQHPDNLSYQIELAEIYIREKKYQDAIDVVNSVIVESPNYVDAYVSGAKAAYMSNDFELTKDYAQKVLNVDINCAQGYYYLAMVRKQEDDTEEAVECMRRAITYDVNNPKFYAQMALLYKSLGDNKTAFEYAKEAESIDSSEEYRILYREFALMNRK